MATDIRDAIREAPGIDPHQKDRDAQSRIAVLARRAADAASRSRTRPRVGDYLQATAAASFPPMRGLCMPPVHIQEATGRQLNDNYFTQTLLPTMCRKPWINVVYDDRGHF
jgi:hypothetical protein